MTCSCTIECDGEYADIYREEKPTARIEHKCMACDRIIKKGERYLCCTYLFNGEWDRDEICCDCVSVREAVFCYHACAFTMWDDIREHLIADPSLPSAECMMQMTKPARDKFCDLLEEIWE